MIAGSLDSASLLVATALSLGAAAMLPGLSAGGRDRHRRLQTLATLLRAPDPAARIDALERAAALEPGDRARLARLLRKELVAGTLVPPAQALTTWFIRQILALLSDSRLRVRADAARMLRDLISRTEPNGGDVSGISPAVGVAVELASRRDHRALVLVKTFTSMPDVGAGLYPWLPVRWLMRNRFDSMARIGQCRRPVFFAHGTTDSLIPFALGKELYEAANEPKRFLTLPGADHNDPLPAVFFADLKKFLAETGK